MSSSTISPLCQGTCLLRDNVLDPDELRVWTIGVVNDALVEVRREMFAVVVGFDMTRPVLAAQPAYSQAKSRPKRARHLRVNVKGTEMLVNRVDWLEAHHRRPCSMKRRGVVYRLLRLWLHNASGYAAEKTEMCKRRKKQVHHRLSQGVYRLVNLDDVVNVPELERTCTLVSEPVIVTVIYPTRYRYYIRRTDGRRSKPTSVSILGARTSYDSGRLVWHGRVVSGINPVKVKLLVRDIVRKLIELMSAQ